MTIMNTCKMKALLDLANISWADDRGPIAWVSCDNYSFWTHPCSHEPWEDWGILCIVARNLGHTIDVCGDVEEQFYNIFIKEIK